MKRSALLSVLLIILTSCLAAQKIEKFFDYNWKPCEINMARFYAVIMNTDSGWLRTDYFLATMKLQMKGLYKDSTCKISNGHFYFFHANGLIESTGQYKDNKKEGLWLSYHPNGLMSDSTVYNDFGERSGTSLQWHNTGYLSDSTVYSPDGLSVSVSWFDNGNISSAGHLNLVQAYHGKWQFFHRNGKLSAVEIYNNGKLTDRKYFTEDGSPMTDTTDKTKAATFPGGIPEWMKYLEKKLVFPYNYQIVNGDRATVVVEFTVNENGDVKDVNIRTPFHPAFDNIALNVFNNAPKWIPAINHNRKVKYNHRQTVTFRQEIR